MVSAIHDLPSAKNYGLGFNYSAWTQGTAVTLCKVPWNSDYRDIVRFGNQATLDNYLKTNSGATIEITKLSYAKFNVPIRLDTPFHTVQNYNYIRVYNPAQPVVGDVGRTFYYFITDVVYVNPNCTMITVQLDVWQTFGYGVKFGNCYIQQGHIGIANTKNFENYGRDYLTVPEGLDIGGEYEISAMYSISLGSARDGEPDYNIMVTSTVSLTDEAGTVEDPKLNSATGSNMEKLPNGADIYFFLSLESFNQYMEAMKEKPWITQGIISIQAVPEFLRYGSGLTGVSIGGVGVYKAGAESLRRIYTNLKTRWRDDVHLERYWRLSKFVTYPYTVLEMTTNTGTPVIMKPESIQSLDLGIVEVPHFAPPDARIAFYPYRYNAGRAISYQDDKGIVHDGAEFTNMATWLSNFPSFSIVNNGFMSYMAANKNNLAYQHSSADWAQTRAMGGNQNSYDQASANMALSENLTGQGINAATQQTSLTNQTMAAHTMVNGIAGIAGGALGGIAGGPLGVLGGTAKGAADAVVAGVNMSIDADRNNQSLGIQNNLARGTTAAQVGTAGYMRDTNKALSDWSANGDYQNQIAGINAKVQDARLTQPTTSGQVGGDAFNLATYRMGLDVKLKTLPPAYMNAIGEYWLRYGYAINRFGRIPDSFMVMEKFTYWKLKETYITEASCPESFKQVIRGIFEKGVTVWANPADIGNIDIADNAPLGGVTL